MSDIRFPEIRRDLIIKCVDRGDGHELYVIKDPLRTEYFEFEELHTTVIRELDGKSTIEEIAKRIGDRFDVILPTKVVEDFVQTLRYKFLLEIDHMPEVSDKAQAALAKTALAMLTNTGLLNVETGMPAADEAQAQAIDWLKRGNITEASKMYSVALQMAPDVVQLKQAHRALQIAVLETLSAKRKSLLAPTFAIKNPERLLGFLARHLAFLFTLPGALAIAAFFFGALFLAIGTGERLIDDLLRMISGGYGIAALIPYILAGWAFGFPLHELAHGTACRYYGGQPRELGVRLMFGIIPGAYCDVSDTHLFNGRLPQVVTFAAGPITDLTLFAVGVYIWWATPSDTPLNRVMIGSFMVPAALSSMQNLVPLGRQDGYYLLNAACKHTHIERTGYMAVQRRYNRIRRKLPQGFLGTVLFTGLALIGLFALFYCYGAGRRFLAWTFRTFMALSIGLYLFALLGWVRTTIAIFVPLNITYLLLRFLVVLHLGIELLIGRLGGIIGVLLAFKMARGFVLKMIDQVPAIPNKPFRSAAVNISLVFWVILLLLAAYITPWQPESTGNAKVVSRQRVAVRAPVPGEIAEVFVHEKDRVSVGDLLFRLRDPNLDLQIVQTQSAAEKCNYQLLLMRLGPTREAQISARARVNRARIQEREAQRIARNANALGDVFSQETLRQAQDNRLRREADTTAVAAHASAALSTDQLQIRSQSAACLQLGQQLDELRTRKAALLVRAPIAGTVTTREVDMLVGSWAAPATDLITIMDLDHLRVEVTTKAEVRREAQIGSIAKIRFSPDIPDLDATVTKSQAQLVDQDKGKETGAIVVTAEIKDPPAWLRAGMVGEGFYRSPTTSLLRMVVVEPLLHLTGIEIWRNI
ncbi:MAG: HlyD family efflux transporter periplasmic adaptor subunit [Deltaproteobacteria bacterium]|nr:HlyD family efflux transporter periplasmic adaptor subunit [Deltaproteobacteria bacterium]